MKTEEFYWLWFSSIDGLTRNYMYHLLECYDAPVHVYEAADRELGQILPRDVMEQWSVNKQEKRVEALKRELEEQQISFIYSGHPEYPAQLKNIPDAPLCLYVKGRLPDVSQRHIAIIGSRRSTVYGREMAVFFAGELAKRGIGVISGLAMGIDGAAHNGALEAGGYTLGFIGGGIYSMYPRENYMLYGRMEKNGGIASEYPPNTPPLGRLFPERNRLISGMSDGVLVIEARKRSGTLITVDQGLEQGKNIYAVPGRITDKNSEGCLHLIRDGAKTVLAVEVILEDLKLPDMPEGNIKCRMKEEEISLAQSEKKVYSCLSLDPVYVDEIIARTGIPASRVLGILMTLELKGLVKQVMKNYYIKKTL